MTPASASARPRATAQEVVVEADVGDAYGFARLRVGKVQAPVLPVDHGPGEGGDLDSRGEDRG